MMNKKIIVTAVIITVIVVFLLMLRCSKTTKKEAPAPEPTSVTEAQPEATAGKEGKSAKPTAVPKTKKGQDLKGFEFDVSKDEKTGDAVLTVKKDGKVIMTKDAGDKGKFKLNTDGKYKKLPVAGKDLTGDGKGNVVVQIKSEKDSCSNMYSMYSLEDDLALVAEIKGLADGMKFHDIDNDGVPEVEGKDCTFLDWWAAFGSAPAPDVILRYRKDSGAYEMAMNMMRKDPPSAEEMQAYADKNQKKFITYIWKYMLDLIYQGNGDKAWEFYDMVKWNPEWTGELFDDKTGSKAGSKEEFLEAFKEHLSTSVYWPEIRSFNGWELLDVEM